MIGDIHADFSLFKHILIKSQLINHKEEWIAKPKDTVIVQVGDLFRWCRQTWSRSSW